MIVHVFQDFCYYANTIFLVYLLFYPRNEKLFLVCFSFAEVSMLSLVIWHLGRRMIHLLALWVIQRLLQGPLAWAMIVWRCSLVFSSLDKIVSVLIHLLPGILYLHFSVIPSFLNKITKFWFLLSSLLTWCFQRPNIDYICQKTILDVRVVCILACTVVLYEEIFLAKHFLLALCYLHEFSIQI